MNKYIFICNFKLWIKDYLSNFYFIEHKLLYLNL